MTVEKEFGIKLDTGQPMLFTYACLRAINEAAWTKAIDLYERR